MKITREKLRLSRGAIAPLVLIGCAIAASVPARAAVVPAGTILEVRLTTPVASYSSKPGAPIQADVVAPVVDDDGRTLIPLGSHLRGRLGDVKRIGLGLVRGRATLEFEFDSLEFPDGTTLDLTTRMNSVENAREKVDKQGRIQGIRATDAFGHKLSGIARNIFFWDPLVHSVLTGTTLAVLRFPESEIYFPAETELTVQITAPVTVRDDWTIPLPRVASNDTEREALLRIVEQTTVRTVKPGDRKPADMVNLIFVGDPVWLERAFDAAGWVRAHKLTRETGWDTFTSVAEARAYPEAPMGKMLLDEQAPDYELSKTLNTYSKRHHVRIWTQPPSFRGRSVLAAASTQDTAIDFSLKRMKLLHLIDRNIDNERAKIVNDLVFAGCVDAAELIDRPWVPTQMKNSSGETITTDGRVLVLELNPCRSAQPMKADETPLRVRGNIWQRIPRQIFLTIRNDFTRNNPIYQAGLGVKYLINKAAGKQPQSDRLRTAVPTPTLVQPPLPPPPPPAQ